MARLEISRSALEHNLLCLLARLNANPRFIGVFKDNAYGHGAGLLAPFYRELGLQMAAVKNEREAAELGGIFKDLLILSQPAKYACGKMGIYALNDLTDFKYYKNEKLMLKLDTGMSRSGIRLAQIRECMQAAKQNGCELLGAFTHFSSVAHIKIQQETYLECAQEYLKCAKELNLLNPAADELARVNEALLRRANAGDFTMRQDSGDFAMRLENGGGDFAMRQDSGDFAMRQGAGDFAMRLNGNGDFAMRSCELANVGGAFFHSAASYGVFAGACKLDGAARAGLALYGYVHEALQPSSRLVATKLSSRELRAGDVVGYDEKFCAQSSMLASNYDLGYADGLAFYDGSWPLEFSGAKVLGKFSMDSFSAACSSEEICLFTNAQNYADAFKITVYEALVRLGEFERILVD